MNIDFTGRQVLVTGSTSGIGFATAKGFLEAGAHVVINGRSQSSVDDALQRLGALASSAVGFVGDLSNESGCQALVAKHPSFDIVINNLGIFKQQDFFETPDSEWQRFFETNVMSGVRVSRAYAQGMVERGWGRIVFISSESGVNIPADMIHYGVTKNALLGLSRGLAKRVAGSGVTVNAVLPGPTLSDGFAAMMEDERARTGKSLEVLGREFVMANRPTSVIQRAATVEEVANMVVYLASPQASATSGAALRVDGGVVDDIV